MSAPAVPLFRAYKRAFLALRSDSIATEAGISPVFAFRPHVLPHVYGPTAVATCALADGSDHHPPHPGCRCGFHGLTDRESVASLNFSGAAQFATYASSALLEVAFYGEVLEGTNGLRASHQQVLSCHLDPRCQVCGAPGTAVAPFLPFDDLDGVEWRMCDSLCPRHLPADVPSFSLAALTSALGIDVDWGDQMPLEFARGARSELARWSGTALGAFALLAIPAAFWLTLLG